MSKIEPFYVFFQVLFQVKRLCEGAIDGKRREDSQEKEIKILLRSPSMHFFIGSSQVVERRRLKFLNTTTMFLLQN